MDDRFSPVLSDARDIYQTKLVRIMTPHLLNLFEGMWRAAHQKPRAFQLQLREVPKWNKDQIEAFTNQILLTTPYLEGAISAVFLAVVKVLSYIRLPTSKTDIRVPVPGKSVFVHTAARVAARELYEMVAAGQPVFADIRYRAEKEVAAEAVRKAVEELLPYQLLLEAYISGEIDDRGTMSPEPFPGAACAPPPESLVPRFQSASESGRPFDEPEPRPEPEPLREEPEPEAEPEPEPLREEPVREEPVREPEANWLDDGESQTGDGHDDGERDRERRVELSPALSRRPIMSREAGGNEELDG